VKKGPGTRDQGVGTRADSQPPPLKKEGVGEDFKNLILHVERNKRNKQTNEINEKDGTDPIVAFLAVIV
jgi:hypothetical protein